MSEILWRGRRVPKMRLPILSPCKMWSSNYCRSPSII